MTLNKEMFKKKLQIFEMLTSPSGEIFHTLALLPRPLSAERKSVEMNGRHQSAPAPQKMQKQPKMFVLAKRESISITIDHTIINISN